MEIYIVRHGETIWNTEKRLQGTVDIELNHYGRALAGETGENLEEVEFDCIFSSPLIRAYETAALIRGHRNIPIIRDARIREICFGIYEGQVFPELLKNEDDPFTNFFKAPENYLPPEKGETLMQLCERTAEFMTEIVEPLASKYNRIMIVAHGASNKAMMCHIKKHGMEHFWSGGLQKNCNVIIVNYDGEKYDIIDETKVFYEEKEQEA